MTKKASRTVQTFTSGAGVLVEQQNTNFAGEYLFSADITDAPPKAMPMYSCKVTTTEVLPGNKLFEPGGKADYGYDSDAHRQLVSDPRNVFGRTDNYTPPYKVYKDGDVFIGVCKETEAAIKFALRVKLVKLKQADFCIKQLKADMTAVKESNTALLLDAEQMRSEVWGNIKRATTNTWRAITRK